MKKSKKLKFITTLSSLGIIGATVPIATTSCSTSEKERSKYLDDFTYDDEDIPASQTLVLNGEGLTFYKQNFAAEYDSKEVEVKNVYIDANDNGRFLEFTRYQNVTHIQPKAINGSQTVILTFTVWDNEDHFLIKTTNIRIVAGNLHTIKYENKLIPGNKDVYIGSPLTLEDSKFSAKYLRQDVKIANVDIYAPQDTEQQYIKRTRIVDEQGKGSWKLTPLKATNAPINLWITVEDNQGHTGTVICSVTILSNVPKTLYYDDKDIPTDDLQVKTITETWYTNKFTAWNSKGEKLSIVSAEITSNDLGEHVKITTGVDEEKGAYNKLYTVKSTPDGYVEIYFDITFKDSENNRYYSHVTQKINYCW